MSWYLVTDPCYIKSAIKTQEDLQALIDMLGGVWFEADWDVIGSAMVEEVESEEECQHCGNWHIETFDALFSSSDRNITHGDCFYSELEDIFVDSGQIAIIPKDALLTWVKGDYDDENSTYKQLCNITQENGDGIFQNIFVTRTTYGDGTYTLRYSKDFNTNKVNAICINLEG